VTSLSDPPAIDAAHLFPILHSRLIQLLRSLDEREWRMPTVAGTWTVKEVAAHLLDTQQRLVSRLRGEPSPSAPALESNADLVVFLNRLNAEGVNRYRRLNPDELIALMDEGAAPFADHHRSLDPLAAAPFGVSWAGEETSTNWFHTARELTERWHHQQQIRLATNRPGIMTRELYHPVLDCFMRALPFSYRDKPAAPGAIAQFTVTGESGGTWFLLRDGTGWRLTLSPGGEPISQTIIPEEIAWRIFTKGIGREEGRQLVRVSGDADLGRHVLDTIAIVA
jgi:uncharacterized protein (TIGR03083 family)